MADDRLISLKEVRELTSLSKTTIYKMVSEGKFPAQLNTGAVRVVWSHNDVQDWIRSIKKAATAS